MRSSTTSTLHPQLRQASLANQQGQWRQSEALARAYLEAAGSDPLALAILGEALLGMRRAIEAENTLREAIAIDPGLGRARLALSASLELQCRISEAVDMLDGWLAEQPGSLDLWQHLAHI